MVRGVVSRTRRLRQCAPLFSFFFFLSFSSPFEGVYLSLALRSRAIELATAPLQGDWSRQPGSGERKRDQRKRGAQHRHTILQDGTGHTLALARAATTKQSRSTSTSPKHLAAATAGAAERKLFISSPILLPPPNQKKLRLR